MKCRELITIIYTALVIGKFFKIHSNKKNLQNSEVILMPDKEGTEKYIFLFTDCGISSWYHFFLGQFGSIYHLLNIHKLNSSI